MKKGRRIAPPAGLGMVADAADGVGREAQALLACSGLPGEVSVMPAGVPLST